LVEKEGEDKKFEGEIVVENKIETIDS